MAANSRGQTVVGIRFDPSDLLKGLGHLATPSSIQRITRPGVTKCARVIRKAARDELKDNRRTGSLSKAMTYAVRVAKGSARSKYGAAPYAIIGPDARKSYPAPAHTITRPTYKQRIKAKSGTVIPTKYAHLLERGTARAAAQPFLRPAFDKSANACRSILVAEINTGIEKESRRIAARGRRVRPSP